MPIKVLSEELALAIAAGEVVERPASVVKELLENSLDAGARRIEILTEGGGRELIEVSDDGCGIPTAEMPLAVARFATSKLSTMQDLFAIESLGFRGEALASIGAVAHIELISRSVDEINGTRLIVDGGQVGEPHSIGTPQGTLVRVRDLFFNMPARRKFLKKDTTERRRIISLVSRYALAYPDVLFKLTQEGRVGFQSSGSGKTRETLAAVFGIETARQMIALSTTADAPVKVEGYISPLSVHRGSRRGMTFFINGRYVQDASLSAAVTQAYHGLLMVGRYPLAVIFLDLPPGDVDVNVHPAKAEIRFRNPDIVFSVVQRVVRATLLGQTPPPAIDLQRGWGQADRSRVISPDWALSTTEIEKVETIRGAQPTLTGGGLPLLRAIGQVGASYLVAEGPDGLYLIDQHAAHERVLFEALMEASTQGEIESQALLEPITIEFTPTQAAILEENLEVMKRLGFEIEPFGQRTYRVRSLPDLLTNVAPEQALRSVVEDFEEDETPLMAETEARLAARVCKRAAVKAGQVLSLVEQQQLLRDLEACQSPRTCPHGRPTMIHLSVEALEKQFGRRG
ncbi:MAG TPA: DNA mismatch repair endonuclease MutL [Anaerolineae bacterium]|nr:DNA mismatch repair endonuclease MutL [Anaerolineae bacterium]